MAISNIGKCTYCGAENVELTIVDDVEHLCDECLDSLYQQCDICKNYYDPGIIEFRILSDGRFVCEYCAEDFDEDEFEDMLVEE